MDFDRDGSPDILAYFTSYSLDRFAFIKPAKSNWEKAFAEGVDSLTVPHPDIPTFGWSNLGGVMAPINTPIPNGTDRRAVRCKVGDDFYYGWMRLYSLFNISKGTLYIVLDKMLFCTIPNYPLVWGQTTAIGDHIDMPFSICPNPTDGVVRVKGKGFATAELFSMAGQRMAVKTKPVEDGLSIDLGGLPAGVYFVGVTDTEGRKSVHKVVRE